MKKLCIIFIGLFICNSASAGLFEYHLGVETPSNASSNGSDVVESIEQYQGTRTYSNSYNPNYTNSYSNNYSNYYTDSYYSSSYSNSSYNRPYTESYYDNISHNNDYYSYNELKRYYEKELENLEREADYIDDIKRDIKLNLSDLRKYNSQYYYDIKASLNDEIRSIERREVDVEIMIDNVEDQIKDLKKNKSNSKTRYYNYYNSGTYFDSWSNSNYNNRYNNNYYYNRRYYKYDYESKKYIPHWVNPDLEDIKDGHIYVR